MPASLSTVVPGLPVPMPSDTAIPGLSRRQVWAAPEVVSFRTDLPAGPGQWLLLAVIAAGAGTPSLAGASLSGQILGSPHVAARSVEIR